MSHSKIAGSVWWMQLCGHNFLIEFRLKLGNCFICDSCGMVASFGGFWHRINWKSSWQIGRGFCNASNRWWCDLLKDDAFSFRFGTIELGKFNYFRWSPLVFVLLHSCHSFYFYKCYFRIDNNMRQHIFGLLSQTLFRNMRQLPLSLRRPKNKTKNNNVGTTKANEMLMALRFVWF